MDKLIVIVILYFYIYLYQNFIRSLNIIEIECLIEKYPIIDDILYLEFNLNQYFTIDDPDVILVNYKINLSIPSNIFPDQQDLIGFEYEMILVNTRTRRQECKSCLIIVKGK